MSLALSAKVGIPSVGCARERAKSRVPEASYLSGGQAYSNSWWACGCFKNYLHPENHEYCEICGMSHEEGSDAFAAEAVLFVATLRTRISNIALPEFSEKELV